MTELTNQCDDCGWILGRYVYTYDDRGYIVAEHTEEAREMDPYGRQPHTSYKPDRTGKNCDHGRNRNLSCYLLVLDKTYTCVKYRSSWPVYYAGLNFFSHYDAGKLLYATGNGVLHIIQKTRTRRPYPEVFTSFSAQIRTEDPGVGKE